MKEGHCPKGIGEKVATVTWKGGYGSLWIEQQDLNGGQCWKCEVCYGEDKEFQIVLDGYNSREEILEAIRDHLRDEQFNLQWFGFCGFCGVAWEPTA